MDKSNALRRKGLLGEQNRGEKWWGRDGREEKHHADVMFCDFNMGRVL